MILPSRLKTNAAVVSLMLGASQASAANFNIPGGDLKAALKSYSRQTGTSLVVSAAAIKGVRSEGVHGDLSSEDALSRILVGTGFIANHHSYKVPRRLCQRRNQKICRPLKLRKLRRATPRSKP